MIFFLLNYMTYLLFLIAPQLDFPPSFLVRHRLSGLLLLPSALLRLPPHFRSSQPPSRTQWGPRGYIYSHMQLFLGQNSKINVRNPSSGRYIIFCNRLSAIILLAKPGKRLSAINHSKFRGPGCYFISAGWA